MRLAQGDHSAYRRVCAALLSRFGGTTNAQAAHNVARVAVLGSLGEGDTARALKLAEAAVTGRPARGSYLTTLGGVYYRLGRFADAARLLPEAVAADAGDNPIARLFLAMTYHRLGRTPEAAEAFAKAARRLDESEKKDIALAAWETQLESRLLRREAAGVLGLSP